MKLLYVILPLMDLSNLFTPSSNLARLSLAASAALYMLFAFLVLIIYILVIYPVFFCRVRHVPGPYISKVTSLWLTYQGYINNANQYIHGLHQIYGPAVRLAPDVISFNSIEAIPAIYGVRSNFPKPPSAVNMNNYGKPNTFSSVSNADHRRRRGRYASSYSKSSVTQGSGYESILRRTKQVLDIIEDSVRGENSVDIYKTFHYYSVDNATVMATGTTMGLLAGINIGYSQDLRDMFIGLAYVFYFSIISLFTRMLPSACAYLVPKSVLKALQAHGRVQEQNFEHYMYSRSIQEPEFEKAVLMRLQECKDHGSSDLTEMHVASEISDHILAGADTLVAGLVYTSWELARPQHKAYLDRLVEEVRSIEYATDSSPKSYAAMDGLRWLECCIREGLRLHTPSGHMQARMVPKGGAMIAGYSIPEETEVGISLYSIQLNRSIFDDPHSFKPQRWLEENSEPEALRRMRLGWMVFGHGARICVGKEFALVQMKLMLGMILNRFTITVDDLQAEEEMEGLQMAVLAPKGGRCLLKFAERHAERT